MPAGTGRTESGPPGSGTPGEAPAGASPGGAGWFRVRPAAGPAARPGRCGRALPVSSWPPWLRRAAWPGGAGGAAAWTAAVSETGMRGVAGSASAPPVPRTAASRPRRTPPMSSAASARGGLSPAARSRRLTVRRAQARSRASSGRWRICQAASSSTPAMNAAQHAHPAHVMTSRMNRPDSRVVRPAFRAARDGKWRGSGQPVTCHISHGSPAARTARTAAAPATIRAAAAYRLTPRSTPVTALRPPPLRQAGPGWPGGPGRLRPGR
jgi:hypothetical protein